MVSVQSCERILCSSDPTAADHIFPPPSHTHLQPHLTPQIETSSTLRPSESPLPQRPPRFYVAEPLSAASSGSLVRLQIDEARHATKTLRLKEGAVLEICDGAGGIAAAELVSIDKAGALVRIAGPGVIVAPKGAWEWTVAVACGSLKGGRADWLVEKCTELGATALQPLLTERSPSVGGSSSGSGGGWEGGKGGKRRRTQESGVGGHSEDETHLKSDGGTSGREARWERVAIAAMKQCLRPRSLLIMPPCSIDALCVLCSQADVAFVGMEGAPPIGGVMRKVASRWALAGKGSNSQGSGDGQRNPMQGVVIVGPEGDFTAEEASKIQAAGAMGVGLGPLRLRTETAALALLTFASIACEDHNDEAM